MIRLRAGSSALARPCSSCTRTENQPSDANSSSVADFLSSDSRKGRVLGRSAGRLMSGSAAEATASRHSQSALATGLLNSNSARIWLRSKTITLPTAPSALISGSCVYFGGVAIRVKAVISGRSTTVIVCCFGAFSLGDDLVIKPLKHMGQGDGEGLFSRSYCMGRRSVSPAGVVHTKSTASGKSPIASSLGGRARIGHILAAGRHAVALGNVEIQLGGQFVRSPGRQQPEPQLAVSRGH